MDPFEQTMASIFVGIAIFMVGVTVGRFMGRP